jgi:uncharacterized lipoprotein YmbA
MKIVSIALLLLLTACSSTPVIDTHYYLLRDGGEVPAIRALSPSSDYALGNVTIAPYIDQPGLTLMLTSGEIRPALYHQWAEPMHQSVRNFLQRQISIALGDDLFPVALSDAPIQLEIRVDQLHGTATGEAVLLAYWWLKQGGKILESYQYGEQIPLQQSGYEALVDTERELLKKFAEHIGSYLKAKK